LEILVLQGHKYETYTIRSQEREVEEYSTASRRKQNFQDSVLFVNFMRLVISFVKIIPAGCLIEFLSNSHGYYWCRLSRCHDTATEVYFALCMFLFFQLV